MRGGFTDINGNAFTASTKFQCLSATQFIMTSVVVYQFNFGCMNIRGFTKFGFKVA